jgi:hypothetical protein
MRPEAEVAASSAREKSSDAYTSGEKYSILTIYRNPPIETSEEALEKSKYLRGGNKKAIGGAEEETAAVNGQDRIEELTWGRPQTTCGRCGI